MKCDKCKQEIKEGEDRQLYSQTLCEDCYIDTLSPAKACDPWAVHSAKSFLEKDGSKIELTPVQLKILKILEETGGAEPGVLLEKLQLKSADLQREVATLRHMEKVKGALREGKKILCLW